jgi:CRISPR-associated protein Cas2
MRRRYIVAYDVTDPKRLRLTHRTLLGFGDPLQYSVFRCDLLPVERIQLLERVGSVIDHRADRVLLADLGPVAGRGARAIEFVGQRLELPPGVGPIIV